jgi:hypothetical protein
MNIGHVIMIGLALIGVLVVWILFFLATLWASEKIVEFYNEVRMCLGGEPDEHAEEYESNAG